MSKRTFFTPTFHSSYWTLICVCGNNTALLWWGEGPFKYYVSMFLAFLGPPTYVSINSTVNQQKLTFSEPTHPPLCWRNTWMVLEAKWPLPESIFTSLWNFYMVLFKIRTKNRHKIRQFWRFQKQTYSYSFVFSYLLKPLGTLWAVTS